MAKQVVLAIDPGITTGYCHAVIDANEIELRPFQLQNSPLQHYKLLDEIQATHLVVEDFTYRPRQTKVIMFPLQLIGVTNMWCEQNDRVATMQTPATGKGFYTDVQLKALGAHRRGLPHAMDATRHLFQWLTFSAGRQFVDPDNAKITTVLTIDR